MRPAPSLRRPVPPPCCREPDRDAISRTLPCSLACCCCPIGGLACRECPRAGLDPGACTLFPGESALVGSHVDAGSCVGLRITRNRAREHVQNYTATHGFSPAR